MARVVVIDFKDNDAAQSFIRILDEVQQPEQEGPVGPTFNEMGLILSAYAQLRGLFARPTAGCRCVGKRKMTGWTHTQRFGWWVCPDCRRPSIMVVRRWFSNMFTSAGNNLLAEVIPPKEVPTPVPSAPDGTQVAEPVTSSATESASGSESTSQETQEVPAS